MKLYILKFIEIWFFKSLKVIFTVTLGESLTLIIRVKVIVKLGIYPFNSSFIQQVLIE